VTIKKKEKAVKERESGKLFCAHGLPVALMMRVTSYESDVISQEWCSAPTGAVAAR